MNATVNSGNDDFVVVRFSEKGRVKENWGDQLNRVLVSLLSAKRALNSAEVSTSRKGPVHLVIGSSMAGVRNGEIVWGHGFMNLDDIPRGTPAKVCAVRGPLTRQKLLDNKIECPEIYGDPALLFPLFYNPDVKKQYEYGIIPHFKDYDAFTANYRERDNVKIINIRGGIETVVQDILSCKLILSSSLHGIIASHAYGVPATWVKLGDGPLGDGFKFRDYWASVGVPDVQPVVPRVGASFSEMFSAGPSEPNNPLVDPRALIECCPFIDAAVKHNITARLEQCGLGLVSVVR